MVDEHLGESSSGLIVDEVKKTVKNEAERTGADLIITDGPPGIGCPVISSIDISVPKAIAESKPVVTAYPDASSSLAIIKLADNLKGIIVSPE